MSGFWLTLLLLIAAVNPAAAFATMSAAPDGGRARALAALIGFGVAAAPLLAVAFGADAILEALELEPETFRVSAGIVLAAAGAATILFGPFAWAVEGGWRGALFPLAFPLLATPAALVAALSRAGDKGEAGVVIAALIVIAAAAGVTALAGGRGRTAADALARLTGALAVVLAAGLIVEGVRAV